MSGFDELQAMKARLAKLPEVSARVAAKAAGELSAIAQASFDAGQGVDGQSFGGVDLNESGRLRAQALRYTAIGTKIRASVGSVPYAKYHIKRGILPRGGAALPTKFNAAIVAIANRELALAVGAP